MERVSVLNKENEVIAGDEVKGGQKMGKDATVEIVPRRGLADISNLQQNNQVARKSQVIPTDIRGFIEKLKQENMELVRLVLERNKMIERGGIEMQKLRINYQKVQQQNLQLAQANTQMLTELNSGKDRLKVLQHELGCIKGLVQARKPEIKVEAIKSVTAGKLAQTDKVEDKVCTTKRKRQSRIQSLDTANDKPIQKTENVGSKRRQSARFKSSEQEPEDSVNRNDELSLVTLKPDQADEKVHRERRQSARFKSSEQEPEDSVNRNDDLSLVTLKLDQADEKVHKERLQSRRQSTRLKSEGKEQNEYLFETIDPLPPAPAEEVQTEKSRANDNRLAPRRQSARLQSHESAREPTRDLDQIDDAKLYVPPPPPLPNEPVSETFPMPLPVLSVKNESEASDSVGKVKGQEPRKSSVRPTRQAAGKVQSYKEIPLNVKMRR